MIQDVTIPAHLCTCEIPTCGYQWISTGVLPPTHCQNRACRSREWNGKKERKIPEPKPQVVLPKPRKVRGGGEDGSTY